MKNKPEETVYTIKRSYKGLYSVDDFIDSIIKTHYYNSKNELYKDLNNNCEHKYNKYWVLI